MDFEKLKEARNNAQTFRNRTGVRIVEIKEKEATCELEVNELLENQIHSIAGGCLYTLADAACGTVCATYGYKATTLNSVFNYLAPGINCKKVYAHAKEIKHGKKISVISVDVYDQDDKHLCNGTFTFAFLKERIDYL